MEYLAIVYSGESKELREERATFEQEARAAGLLVARSELASAQEATTVRVREGRTLVSEGPVVEAGRGPAGYFLLDCPSLDEALDWAARISGADGAVEVRAVYSSPEEEQL